MSSAISLVFIRLLKFALKVPRYLVPEKIIESACES